MNWSPTASSDWSTARLNPWRRAEMGDILDLGAGAVHVWRIELDVPALIRARLWTVLTEDERRRALRFHFAADTERFVVAHAALRLILARYLGGADPAALCFSTGAFGKPALAGAPQFNLSHSDALALCAVARTRVGVDVERIRPDFATDDIASSHFSRHENAALRAVPPAQRSAAFFACWARKEAYIKARGEGLSLALDTFDVSLSPGETAAIVGTRPDPAEARRWSLSSLDVGRSYAAAVVLEGELACLGCWQWVPNLEDTRQKR